MSRQRLNFKNRYGNYYQAKVKFNRVFSSVLSGMEKSLIDGIMNIHEDIFLGGGLIGIFEEVQIPKDIEGQLLTIADKTKNSDIGFNNSNLQEVYRLIKTKYFIRLFSNISIRSQEVIRDVSDLYLEKIKPSKELEVMVSLDRKYVETSFKRLKLLLNKFKVSLTTITEIFIEDRASDIYHELNSFIEKDIVESIRLLESSGVVLGESFKYLLSTDISVVSGDRECYIYSNGEYINNNVEKENEDSFDDIEEVSMFEEGIKYSYIDDYKKLSKLAEDNGFTFVRCNGDHGIFKHINGGITVIPQGRSIGKGLSIKIQKSIYNLSKKEN